MTTLAPSPARPVLALDPQQPVVAARVAALSGAQAGGTRTAAMPPPTPPGTAAR